MRLQRVEQGATLLLQDDGDGGAGKALVQPGDPFGQASGFCSKVVCSVWVWPATRRATACFSSRPIDGDESSKVRLRSGPRSGRRRRNFIHVRHGCAHIHVRHACQLVAKPARWLGLGEVLIGETSDVDILSIRFEPKRRAGSESLSQDVATIRVGEFVFPARRDRGAIGSQNRVYSLRASRAPQSYSPSAAGRASEGSPRRR